MEKTITISEAKQMVRCAVRSFPGYKETRMRGDEVVLLVTTRGSVAAIEALEQFPSGTVGGFPITIQETGEVEVSNWQ